MSPKRGKATATPRAALRSVGAPDIPPPTFEGQRRPMSEAEKQRVRDETDRLNEHVVVTVLKSRPNIGDEGEQVQMRRAEAEKYARAGYVRIDEEA